MASATRPRRGIGHRAALLLSALVGFGALVLVLFASLLGSGARDRAACGRGGEAAYAPSAAALADIPGNYLELYIAAGQQFGIDWALLAAIGWKETTHGRSTLAGVHSGINTEAGATGAGCCAGPMQFNIADGSWQGIGIDANGDGRTDVYDPRDAIPSAARKLRSQGAPADYRAALRAYNNSEPYIAAVLARADVYRGAARQAGALPVGAAPLDADTGSECLGGAALALAQGSGADVLAHPNITIYPGGQADLRQGTIDPRITGLLLSIAQSHQVTLTSLRSGHGFYTASGNQSAHSVGRAVDIGAVDGVSCTHTSPSSPCGRLALELAALRGAGAPSQVIFLFDPDGRGPVGLALADHHDHIHVGYPLG